MKIKFASIVNLFLVSAVLGSGFGYSHLYLFHLCLVLLVGCWIYFDVSGANKYFIKPKSSSLIFFILMFSWYALGLLWSIEPIYTLKYLSYIFFGIVIVFVIVCRATTENSYKSIYNVLKIWFLVEIAIALLEAFTPFRLPTSPYSSYSALFGRKATDFGLFENDIVLYIKSAPTAFHGNPNNLAVVMATLLPFFLFSEKIIIKVTGSFAIFIIIIMTGSRGSFIGAIFGITLYLAITNIRRFLILIFCGIVGFSSLIGSLDSLKVSENSRIAEFAQVADVLITYLTQEDMSGGSVSVRQELIRNGLDALYATHGLGVGGGGSVAVQERVGGVGGRLTSMHNFWIELLVESGFVFFILFVLWYLIISVRLLIIYKKSKSQFIRYQSGALFTSFAVFSVACISASSVIYHLPMWIMFGMGAALINIWVNSESLEVSAAT